MVASFRYDSPWEQFEKSVKLLKELISQNQAYWMIGYMRDLDIYIDETVEETLQEDVLNIIHEEIVYLLYCLLEKENMEENNIKEILVEAEPEISEKELQEMVTSALNKFELVKDAFDIDKLAIRNNLKKETLNAKLLGFEYNIYIAKLTDGEKAECAIINFSSKKNLKSLQGKPLSFLEQIEERKNEVSFLCDREDLDLLIHQLETLRRKMEDY